MALRSGYKGFKKLLAPLKIIRPGTLGIDNDVLIPELNETFFPRSEQAVLGAKNLISVPYFESNKSENGVTWTVNSDGSVTGVSSDTPTSATGFVLNQHIVKNTIIAGKTYILNGCPSGGDWGSGNNKYCIYIFDEGTGSPIAAMDTGNGALFTPQSGHNYTIRILIGVNATGALNLTFKPMLRLVSDSDSTYAPYAMTNRELTDAVTTLNGSASDQKTAINAIITAATGAADFTAFKTAMGAITPVTRSLSRTASPEDVPEEVEVKEEVIEEKPVTRKTTKKSTVKEGE